MCEQARRSGYIHSGIWIIGFGLLVAACILIALSLPVPSPDGAGVMLWAESHRATLQLADELLVFSAPTILAAALVIYDKIKLKVPFRAAAMLALVIVLISGIMYTVFALGRLVYPVNGLSITPEIALLSASQVFAGLHFIALALVPFVLVVALVNGSRMVLAISGVVALLQIIGTYYADEISVPLAIMAMGALFGWSVMIGWMLARHGLNTNEEKTCETGRR